MVASPFKYQYSNKYNVLIDTGATVSLIKHETIIFLVKNIQN